MAVVVAVDQGTTGSTVLVMDRGGRVVGRAYKEFTQHFPKPGWVEHDPEEIWQVTLGVLRQACRKAKVRGRDVAAIGITNQRETVVLWDRRTGKPVHRAIVWQDRRTAEYCAALRARGHEDLIRRKTGLVIDPYFSGTKLRWLLQNVKRAAERAARGELCFGTIDSWLLWKLTGGAVHATDPTNASRTLLYDIGTHAWDAELCRLLEVPDGILPAVKPSSGIFGETTADVLGVPVPVAGIAGDQQSALFGQGCVEPGMAKNTHGTGCFLLVNTGQTPVQSRNGLLTTVACDATGRPAYALEGAVFIAGAAIQWLRDGLGVLSVAKQSEAMARAVRSTLGVYFVPAFVGLGAPYWDANARGAIVGLTRGVTREHLARAALEALAYQTRDVADAMAADAGRGLTSLRVDGGAAANDFLMQFQADVLNTPVERPKLVETTAMGAAQLAGIATGFWRTPADLERARKKDRRFTPKMKAEEREALYRGWQDAVRRGAFDRVMTADTFAGVGGVPIHWRRFEPPTGPRGVVLLSHGYAEHLGRYAHVADHLTARGLAVAGVDHRGHGRSGGPRGHALDLDEMVDDLRTLADHAERHWPGVPRVLLGHSMGGLIGFLYLLRHPDTVRAGMLSAPALRIPDHQPRWLQALARGLASVAPRLRFTTALAPDALARDPLVGEAYVADPLVHRAATAGFVRAMHRGQAAAFAGAPDLTVPVLIVQGDADRLVLPAGAREISARIRCPHELVMLPGFYHELLNEPPLERAKVFALIDDWFDRWLAR